MMFKTAKGKMVIQFRDTYVILDSFRFSSFSYNAPSVGKEGEVTVNLSFTVPKSDIFLTESPANFYIQLGDRWDEEELMRLLHYKIKKKEEPVKRRKISKGLFSQSDNFKMELK